MNKIYKYKSLRNNDSLLYDRTYEYITEDIKYFTTDSMNKIANIFYIEIVSPNYSVDLIEFEAILITEICDKPIIYKTVLSPYQFTYLSEELTKSLKIHGLFDTENKSDNLVFRFKLIKL
jgi:hypothetical protein